MMNNQIIKVIILSGLTAFLHSAESSWIAQIKALSDAGIVDRATIIKVVAGNTVSQDDLFKVRSMGIKQEIIAILASTVRTEVLPIQGGNHSSLDGLNRDTWIILLSHVLRNVEAKIKQPLVGPADALRASAIRIFQIKNDPQSATAAKVELEFQKAILDQISTEKIDVNKFVEEMSERDCYAAFIFFIQEFRKIETFPGKHIVPHLLSVIKTKLDKSFSGGRSESFDSTVFFVKNVGVLDVDDTMKSAKLLQMPESDIKFVASFSGILRLLEKDDNTQRKRIEDVALSIKGAPVSESLRKEIFSKWTKTSIDKVRSKNVNDLLSVFFGTCGADEYHAKVISWFYQPDNVRTNKLPEILHDVVLPHLEKNQFSWSPEGIQDPQEHAISWVWAWPDNDFVGIPYERGGAIPNEKDLMQKIISKGPVPEDWKMFRKCIPFQNWTNWDLKKGQCPFKTVFAKHNSGRFISYDVVLPLNIQANSENTTIFTVSDKKERIVWSELVTVDTGRSSTVTVHKSNAAAFLEYQKKGYRATNADNTGMITMTLAETKQVPESKSMECFTADIWSSTNAKIKQEK